MNNPIVFGKLQSEKHAEENNVCRQIVREISHFGVNQRQTLFIIYLLSLELENIDLMRELTSLIKELGGSDVFIADSVENKVIDG